MKLRNVSRLPLCVFRAVHGTLVFLRRRGACLFRQIVPDPESWDPHFPTSPCNSLNLSKCRSQLLLDNGDTIVAFPPVELLRSEDDWVTASTHLKKTIVPPAAAMAWTMVLMVIAVVVIEAMLTVGVVVKAIWAPGGVHH
jgi:hypothetical protein